MDPNIGSSLYSTFNKTMNVVIRTQETPNNKQNHTIVSIESMCLLESEWFSPKQDIVHDLAAGLSIEDTVEVYLAEVFLFR